MKNGLAVYRMLTKAWPENRIIVYGRPIGTGVAIRRKMPASRQPDGGQHDDAGGGGAEDRDHLPGGAGQETIRERPAPRLRDINLKALEITLAYLSGGDTHETL